VTEIFDFPACPPCIWHLSLNLASSLVIALGFSFTFTALEFESLALLGSLLRSSLSLVLTCTERHLKLALHSFALVIMVFTLSVQLLLLCAA